MTEALFVPVVLNVIRLFGKYRLEYRRDVGFARVYWSEKAGSGDVHCGYFLRKCKGKWYHQSYISANGLEQSPPPVIVKEMRDFLNGFDHD